MTMIRAIALIAFVNFINAAGHLTQSIIDAHPSRGWLSGSTGWALSLILLYLLSKRE